MGRAEARRARQRGGERRAAARSQSDGIRPRGARRAARGKGGGKGGIRRFFTWKRVLGTLFGLCLLAMGGFVALYVLVPVPVANEQAQQQSNVYKYADGSLITRTGEVNREIVGLDRVPKDVQKTFVAAENKTFYKDQGIDLKGTARGVFNTLTGKGKQGGSTITQQYVKNYYLNQDQTVTRKLKELVISLKVDQKQSKDEILAGYINTSYYGRGAYGIQAAAQAYYGIDAEELTVEQGAYLAALLQAPSQYDWAVASPASKKLVEERWNYVLDNMVEEDWLDAGERSGMKFDKPDKPKPEAGKAGQAGYLVDAADQQIVAELMRRGDTRDDAEAKLKAGGWTVTLNIDPEKQKALQNAVDAQLNDKLDTDERKVDAAVQAGVVSVDPKTGAVIALYGGEDYLKHYQSNATRDDYQPGSTFKPVILASALENDATTQDGTPIRAGTVYDGTSGRPVEGGEKPYAPPNEGKKDYGDITVQRAMDHSVNSVYAQMGADVGMDRVAQTASDLGMQKITTEPAMTLGSMGASPMEMAGVYATLDNHGKKVTPSILKSATHKDREKVQPEPLGEQVVQRTTADSVTSVLQGVVNDGTGSVVGSGRYAGKYEAAGKTGTSDNNVSAWFAGYTPEMVTVVGMFGEAPEGGGGLKRPGGAPAGSGDHVSLAGAGGDGKIHGSGFPSRIWAAYTLGALNGGSDAEFDLDTDMGAGVEPPPSATTEPESADPTETPSAPPTSQDPTTAPPSTATPPTDGPTTVPPTTGPTGLPTSPAPSGSWTIPTEPGEEPGNPDRPARE
ncbi:transglycosylase domain-containing protein [Streptomyces sp. B-S-A8]|uniref:Transglycosylase domain-containing protein n=1 Tax=Streptomyces solicavernae TaxID=3043614 RepID=A0ABT6RZG1_9ACTN|nr:transglycosylase domain-containing protein [Streptomyces sp. B-S-A8]MDI3389819.1 transglycosylase domain-containing protein [Streptomyces sp. B-S-A8]